MSKQDYLDIKDYGIIGNLETTALIGVDGSIDWLCLPYTDSASIFAALLDAQKGGHFKIAPLGHCYRSQRYIEDTNVLQTIFTNYQGELILTDFMPVVDGQSGDRRGLYRKVECKKGSFEVAVVFQPKFDYGRTEAEFSSVPFGVEAAGGGHRIHLATRMDLDRDGDAARGVFRIRAGDVWWFTLFFDDNPPRLDAVDGENQLDRTIAFWREWMHHCQADDCIFNLEWHEVVMRAGLMLKLLHDPVTGGIYAAPTASLPEELGGSRNWDYRYSWIRDASFTVQALYHMGYHDEAESFRRWIESIIGKESGKIRLKVLYSVRSADPKHEQVLDYLEGYRNSKPVRIGNQAVAQKQLDVYGELVNALYETSRYGKKITKKIWADIVPLIETARDQWKEKDAGIWEIRSEPRHHVYSKIMCWVALDRGIKISEEHGYGAPVDDWQQAADEIKQTVIDRGFNKQLNSFVQSFDSDIPDAACLMIPALGFLSYEDPRVQGTIEFIQKELLTGNGLVFRYKNEDGLGGTEGAFVICSFWLIKCLILSGKLEAAEQLFNKVLHFFSPLGLISEEVDPTSGRLLGNYPQAFSLIGLINAAVYLGVAKGKKDVYPTPMGIRDELDNIRKLNHKK